MTAAILTTAKPETKSPVLMCDACEKPTRHNYCGTRQRRNLPLFDHVYECPACNSVRPWGFTTMESVVGADEDTCH